MNRFILKYAYPITAVILVIFAWVIYSSTFGVMRQPVEG